MHQKLDKNIKLIVKDFELILDFSTASLLDFNAVRDYLSALDFGENDIEYFRIQESEIVINNELLYHKDEFGEELCSLHNLLLPSIKSEMWVSIEDSGFVNLSSYKFTATMYIRNIKNSVEYYGCVSRYAGVIHIMPEVLYRATSIINHHKIEDKSSDNNWSVLEKLKNLALESQSHIAIKTNSFMNKQNVKSIDKVALKSSLNNRGDMVVEPTFPNVDADINQSIIKQINSNDIVLPIYTVDCENNQKQKIIVSEKLKSGIQSIIDKPTLNKSEISDFLKDPTRIYTKFSDPELMAMLDLSAFSERVKGYGVIEKNNITITNDNDWVYPVKLEFADSNGEIVPIGLVDKSNVDEFVTEIKEALSKDYGYFSVNEKIIPLTNSNKLELEKIIDINAGCGDTKVEKYITIKDVNNETIRVKEKSLKSIARRIDTKIYSNFKNLEKSESTNFTILSFEMVDEINDRVIELTEPLLKLIYKNLKLGLLIKDSTEYNHIKDRLIINSEELIKDPILPPTLRQDVTLKKHQNEGVAWLQNCYNLNRKGYGYAGVMLADDMGLGKTLQILTFIELLIIHYNVNKAVLIVAPKILLEGWKNEYNRFFSGQNEPFVLHGRSLDKYKIEGYSNIKESAVASGKIPLALDIDKLSKHKVIVTNYDTLEHYETSFAAIDFGLVVLDEAQNIKNPQAHCSRVAKSLKSVFKVAITGTPVENSLIDIWNIFNFLNQDVLLPLQQFKAKFITEKANVNEIKETLKYQKPYAFLLRRVKSNELDLPNKELIVHDVDYDKEQYEEIIKCEQAMRKMPSDASQLFYQLNALHQSYALIKHDYTLFKVSNKAKQLYKIIDQIRSKNEKVLIFAIWKDMQEYLKQFLEESFRIKISIINGNTKNTVREKALRDFETDPDKFIMILSPRAAGVGLTIVSANHVIHYGRWWNPAVELQATDRVYRIGQTKSVKVHYLIHRDNFNGKLTFDERLNSLLARKTEVADDFLSPLISDEEIKRQLNQDINP